MQSIETSMERLDIDDIAFLGVINMKYPWNAAPAAFSMDGLRAALGIRSTPDALQKPHPNLAAIAQADSLVFVSMMSVVEDALQVI